MRLVDLLSNVSVIQRVGRQTADIASITQDSRSTAKNSLYVAVRGTQVDGHLFIPAAIKGGAVAVVCEQLPSEYAPNVAYAVVPDSSLALGHLASAFYDHPSRSLLLVGVTGTNGKTTTATLLHAIASRCGIRAGLLSTIQNVIVDRPIPTTHTTLDAVSLQRTLKSMVDSGCSHAFMEVTSHAIVQERVAGVQFSGGVFTNLTHDHLDYHGTIDAYAAAKKRLFTGLPPDAFALTNLDDPWGQRMTDASAARLESYAFESPASFPGTMLRNTLDGVALRVGDVEIWSHLVGRFNAYNLLAAFAAATLIGLNVSEVVDALEDVRPIRGRFDWVQGPDERVGVVDFAHTPDGLENLMRAARDVFPGRRIVLVVGCGGERDREKRSVMGRIASEAADSAIFTSDNPRGEYAANIIEAMLLGVPLERRDRVTVINDRKEAIHVACELARPNGVVLVAGKGHEQTQIIGSERRPFDDRQVLDEALVVQYRSAPF